jgi:uncharacterized protein YegJ (DUF2314 family)
MMLARALLCLALAGLAAPATAQLRVENAEADRPVSIEYDSEDMAEGVRHARATLGAFFALAENPRAGTEMFAIKIGLPTPRGKEYVWARLLRRNNERVVAQIDNIPRWTTRFRQGQMMTVGEAEIIDWLYIDGDRLKGNFTGCALNKMSSPAEAEAMRQRFRMTCEE